MAGFTLIELMVVVLIIAILIAIAIPTFLGARARAQDRAAQFNLRNALAAQKVYYTDRQAYTVDTTALAGIEPSLTWAANAAVATVGTVYVAKATSTRGSHRRHCHRRCQKRLRHLLLHQGPGDQRHLDDARHLLRHQHRLRGTRLDHGHGHEMVVLQPRSYP
jgi:prepilin-type N-terminal cleavage/methylation domain-containing protein